MERYEKGKVLGVGTFGEVFKAVDKKVDVQNMWQTRT